MRILLPALVLLASASASAQTTQSPAIVVLQHTRTGGVDFLAPGAPRAADSDAAVVTWADGGWTLQVLGDGETARDAQPVRVRPLTPNIEALGRTQRALMVQARQLAGFHTGVRPVVFSVEATVPAPGGASATDAVAALAAALDEDDALTALTVVSGAQSTVSAEFAFESVEAWTAWTARSAAWRRLEALGEGTRSSLSVRH